MQRLRGIQGGFCAGTGACSARPSSQDAAILLLDRECPRRSPVHRRSRAGSPRPGLQGAASMSLGAWASSLSSQWESPPCPHPCVLADLICGPPPAPEGLGLQHLQQKGGSGVLPVQGEQPEPTPQLSREGSQARRDHHHSYQKPVPRLPSARPLASARQQVCVGALGWSMVVSQHLPFAFL